MAFILENWDSITAGPNNNVPAWYSYMNRGDTITTIVTSGYFNNRITLLKVGDIVHAQGSNDYALAIVGSVTTNVTLIHYAGHLF